MKKCGSTTYSTPNHQKINKKTADFTSLWSFTTNNQNSFAQVILIESLMSINKNQMSCRLVNMINFLKRF